MSKISLQVFLSSPGDVSVERGMAREILDQLKTDPLIRNEIDLEIVAWDDPKSRTYMPLTLTPQQAIDLGLPRPADCAIFVMLLWGRMGTPLDVDKHGAKSNGEQYWSGTEWEYLDALAANEQHGTFPLIYLYHRTDDSAPPQQKDFKDWQEYIDALQDFPVQLVRVKEFLKQFRGAGGTYLGNVHPYDTPNKFKELFEIDARILVRTAYDVLTGKTSPAPTKKVPEWVGSPFPGLRAFTATDEPIYFGRGRETADLVKRLTSTPFVAVVGASGSGKSSLVGAGLIPQLKRNAIAGSPQWLVIRFTPTHAPYLRLAEALIDHVPALAGDPVNYAERCETLAANLARSPQALAQTLRHTLKNDPNWTKVVLFVDQFEELLTLAPPEQLAPFAEMLCRTDEIVRVVLTLRADFYHKAVENLTLAEKLREGSFPLSKPSAIALYEMIVKPAERAGLIFEEGLAEQIVKDTGDDAGALALMAYTLDELYHACKDKQHITFADYKAVGGVQGAIGKRAEETFKQLTGSDEDKIQLLERVFHQLVSVDERGVATRQRLTYDPATLAPAETALIEAFTTARLLVQDSTPLPLGEGQEVRANNLEIAHEALLRNWERLANWIEQTRGDLFLLAQMRRAAQLWEERHRNRDFLWLGERGQDIQAMLERLNPTLNETEQAFARLEQAHLLDELEDSRTTHVRREAIGQRLNEIGDTRRGVGLRSDGLPDIEWCYVAGGQMRFEIEKQGNYLLEIPDFYIAKYLVTYVQFQAFVDDPDGFLNRRWWVTGRDKLEEQRQRYATYPRDYVRWGQAVAFTQWMTAKVLPLDIPLDWTIRLPLEWEWQWAAQGGTATKDYPWGEWDNLPHANTSEAGLGKSCAVGLYPHGVADCGAWDMSGNLWEWCLNEHDNINEYNNKSMNYKALRGGAFFDSHGSARCASRYDGQFSVDRGFRVLCGSAPSFNEIS